MGDFAWDRKPASQARSHPRPYGQNGSSTQVGPRTGLPLALRRHLPEVWKTSSPLRKGWPYPRAAPGPHLTVVTPDDELHGAQPELARTVFPSDTCPGHDKFVSFPPQPPHIKVLLHPLLAVQVESHESIQCMSHRTSRFHVRHFQECITAKYVLTTIDCGLESG
jgi:hypothetical protein